MYAKRLDDTVGGPPQQGGHNSNHTVNYASEACVLKQDSASAVPPRTPPATPPALLNDPCRWDLGGGLEPPAGAAKSGVALPESESLFFSVPVSGSKGELHWVLVAVCGEQQGCSVLTAAAPCSAFPSNPGTAHS
ncbi:hypothetical protein MHYP_G00083810 [Metynnis hypsauchen]